MRPLSSVFVCRPLSNENSFTEASRITAPAWSSTTPASRVAGSLGVVGTHAEKNKPKEKATFRATFTGQVYQLAVKLRNLATCWLFLRRLKLGRCHTPGKRRSRQCEVL